MTEFTCSDCGTAEQSASMPPSGWVKTACHRDKPGEMICPSCHGLLPILEATIDIFLERRTAEKRKDDVKGRVC